MPSGEEIQHALRGFVDTWRDYSGSEKSEAQTFLNQLCDTRPAVSHHRARRPARPLRGARLPGWFPRAADHLALGQRVALGGTNSISQNLGRSASLDYIVAQGGVLTDAISSQKWPGDAKVHVSIVNWVDGPIESLDPFTLDGMSVGGITRA